MVCGVWCRGEDEDGSSKPEVPQCDAKPAVQAPNIVTLPNHGGTTHLVLLTSHSMASIQRAAVSPLRTAARPTMSRRIPALARWQSRGPADLPEPPIPQAGIIFRGEEAGLTSEAIREHNPDYNVAVDYRTS